MAALTQGSELDTAAALVRRAASNASLSAMAAVRVQQGDTSAAEEAFQRAKEAKESAEQALRRLLAAGAARPGPPVAVDTLPLHLLDTPANRRFLAALEAAAEAGAEVDRERGWVDSDGESTGHGETLAGLALLARREIFGPTGRD